MIPRIEKSRHTPAWQNALMQAVGSVDELLRLLHIDSADREHRRFNRDFPLRVPRGFIARMEPGNIHDPLLRQVLPLAEEDCPRNDFLPDPLHEAEAMPVPGLLHKYRGRALLTLTGACAIHCRYCFRRHFPYAEANPLSGHRDRALAYLAGHTGIRELILSGGDPLTLPDTRLGALARELAAIPHIQTLRLHTRLPIVLPERVDRRLLAWLGAHPQRLVMVVHCNHPNEIDASVVAALRKLAQAGVLLLNQSVLLKGINDQADTLVQLSQALLAAGVLPYYLHQLDRVQGAAHFEVSDTVALALMDGLHAALPGYLVPRLVRELPEFPGKYPLWPGP
jgi:EF-P beta-lysylation protein EpmB